ncbi:major capsid protein [Methylobacter marinus]|uniref:major capsid protein n=1 Tax=Methylobacter marinus TaxID=34058 RepID=UPI000380027F|nr:hypothetical protein [Methylobacter marinus]
MGLTLIEAAKIETGNEIRRAIIELYAGSSDILMALPFDDITGNALKYNREESLPGVGFRGVNESYTPSTGVLNPQTENLVIAGGELDVDTFIVQTMGMEQRSVQEAMKVRALGLAWTRKFIKGDQLSDPREFDGLQTRITGAQKIAAGATANGTALSLGKLDEAIDQTLNPTHLLMSKAMRRRLTQAARNSSVGGFISYDKDAFGRTVTMYNDLPILIVDQDNEGNAILPFTEAATSGTATATSIYVLSLGSGMLSGIQNGGIQVDDMGKLQASPLYRTRVEWFNGLCIMNGRAATRLWSIADAPITA